MVRMKRETAQGQGAIAMKNAVIHHVEGGRHSYTDLLRDPTYGFFIAEYFHQVLYLERKRRERSERTMFLLLIDIMRIPEEEQESVIGAISQTLSIMTRETDIKGWYSPNQAIGVIFTEFKLFDQQAMLKKIKDGLERILPHEHMEKLQFSIYVFPQDRESGQPELAANLVLYPEVSKKYETIKGPFFLKRFVDIVGSIVGLVIFSPFFLVIPMLIKITSPGPVLFRQERIGLYGKRFTFLKFRTMFVDNDPCVHQEYVRKLIAGEIKGNNGGSEGNGDDGCKKPVFKITNDRRITPVGKYLRNTSMDELPQFINVLRGDMSLVGPRPPIPYEVQNYDIWHRTRVVEVKPGITGLWQVMGRSTTSFDEMVRLDIKYARECSFWLDMKILVKTPWAVLRGKGAY
jgi:lipopolysaccharide/colanic/teichoic acid biosynthesis glycosyltransferase